MALSALMLGIVASTALAKETAQQITAKRAISSIYANVDRAMVKKQIGPFEKQLAPTFQLRTSKGTVMNRRQVINLQKTFLNPNGPVITGCKTIIQKVDWRGKDAVFRVKSTIAAKQMGTTLIISNEMQDYWRQSKQGWAIFKSVELKTTSTINGRVMPGI